jgi:transcriptional regulator with XRE-family HTH domain
MTGLSQLEMAKLMGVHSTRPSKWEAGNPMAPASDRLFRAFVLFGIVQQHLVMENPIDALTSASSVIRKIDVREILKNIDGKSSTAKQVRVTKSPDSYPGASWFLPGLEISGNDTM